MKKWLINNWYIISVIVVMTIGIYFLTIVTIKDYNHAKTIKSPKEQCEQHNGIYMYGGLGAGNCVFPPKESNKNEPTL